MVLMRVGVVIGLRGLGKWQSFSYLNNHSLLKNQIDLHPDTGLTSYLHNASDQDMLRLLRVDLPNPKH